MQFPEYVRDVDINIIGTVADTNPHNGTFAVEWEDGEETTEYLRGEGVSWTRLLSRSVANECLALVRAYVRDDGAALREPGHEGPYWSIDLEGGPEEWAYRISQPGSGVAWPDGVWVEPVSMSWCISLHVK